ncbi:MAG: GGDEF domain-containing protein [Acidobacteriota bacterium]|nr:GGDEF domain-containing protein [Acidobacteriota bacterium]
MSLLQADESTLRDSDSRPGMRLVLSLCAAALVGIVVTAAFGRTLQNAIATLSPSRLAIITTAAFVLVTIAAGLLLRARWSRDRVKDREVRTLRETNLLLQNRAGELEMMMRMAESLGQALDTESLKKVILDHLQPLVPGHEIWLSTKESGWQPIVGARPLEARIGGTQQAATWHTFPLLSQQKLVGVLGVRHGDLDLTAAEREVLQAAAALLTVAVKNVQLFRKVRDLAVLEPLTGCVTRHHGIERLGGELRRAQRSHMPISVVMLDLDHFKSVNDRNGHLCGDKVLAGVGRILRETLRTSDERCRYGGEEFLIVLPDTTSEGACRVAENLRARFAATPILCARGAVRVTASLGVAQALPGEADVNAVLGRADAALYAAKAAGRNRVCSQTPTGPVGVRTADAAEVVRLHERRDTKRPDRRHTIPSGRRATDWQQTH